MDAPASQEPEGRGTGIGLVASGQRKRQHVTSGTPVRTHRFQKMPGLAYDWQQAMLPE